MISICTCGMAAKSSGISQRCSCVSMRIEIGDWSFGIYFLLFFTCVPRLSIVAVLFYEKGFSFEWLAVEQPLIFAAYSQIFPGAVRDARKPRVHREMTQSLADGTDQQPG